MLVLVAYGSDALSRWTSRLSWPEEGCFMPKSLSNLSLHDSWSSKISPENICFSRKGCCPEVLKAVLILQATFLQSWMCTVVCKPWYASGNENQHYQHSHSRDWRESNYIMHTWLNNMKTDSQICGKIRWLAPGRCRLHKCKFWYAVSSIWLQNPFSAVAYCVRAVLHVKKGGLFSLFRNTCMNWWDPLALHNKQVNDGQLFIIVLVTCFPSKVPFRKCVISFLGI